MNPFDYIKTLSHHAYFIHSFNDVAEQLKEYLKNKFHIDHSNNPDFFHEKFDLFGIDESRKIKEKHSSKSFSENSKKIFLIEASGITQEAQNSLLKIFEEPHENTHFFLIMPSSEILLPTLKSRLSIPKSNNNLIDKNLVSEVEKFLNMSKKDMISFVDDIAKKISDDDLDKTYAQDFLSALEFVLHKKDLSKNRRTLNAIVKAKDYLNDRSPSIKQLLEYIALSI